LKTRLCIAGRRALYRYCAERGIAHRRCGKLLVATDEEELALLRVYVARTEANGFGPDEALVPLSADAARALEPELRCRAAWLSPATGIVDSHALMRALLTDAEAHGALLVPRTLVAAALSIDGGFRVTTGGSAPTEVQCRRLINAAGLGATELARHVAGYDPARIPRQYLVKGNYFTFSGRSPFTHPIYPPQRGGSSIHATIDVGGQLKFGPDAEPVDALDYTVDPARAERFYAAIRTYWPELPDGSLQPGYAGIRPRLQAPGEPFKDFVIDGPTQHGIDGLVQLFGIESPGLTACLAIAAYVRGL
jgi:L-2-hydroxyglutarate oxidase LhgO